MRKLLLALLIMSIIFVSGCASNPPQGTGCTQEAKICPDGTAVGRTGPNCEFTPCPDTDTASSGN